jgi:hypothetical protein
MMARAEGNGVAARTSASGLRISRVVAMTNGRIVAIERRLAAAGRTLGVVRLAITEMGRATVGA